MSHRIDQINKLIQKNLGLIISREIEFPKGLIVSISKVVTGPDLKEARVYVSVMPEKMIPDAKKFLEKNKSVISKSLASTLTMKFSPKIEFKIDESIGKANRIEDILDSLT
jgi:ribosome-binding factor A